MTALSLPIHEHGIFLHLFSFFITFIKILYFPSYRFLTYFVRFTLCNLGSANVNINEFIREGVKTVK